MRRGTLSALLAATAIAALNFAAAALGFDPELEAKNFAKTSEREQYVTLTSSVRTALNVRRRQTSAY